MIKEEFLRSQKFDQSNIQIDKQFKFEQNKLTIISEENSCNKNNDTNEGMRDILLIKCKTAIEELHLEIDDTNQKKQQLEEKYIKLEFQNAELDKQKRELASQLQRCQHELSLIKISQTDQDDFNKQINNYQKKEQKFIKELENLAQINMDQKTQISNLEDNLHKREIISDQWQDELGQLEIKMQSLARENQILEKKLEAQIKVEMTLKQNSLAFEDQHQNCLANQLQIENMQEENSQLKSQIKHLKSDKEHQYTKFQDQLKQKDEEFKLKIEKNEKLIKDNTKQEINEFKKDMIRTLDKLESQKQIADKELQNGYNII